MKSFLRKLFYSFSVLSIVILIVAGCKNYDRTWSVYKADQESSSYSPLTQINRTNVSQLQIAWTFSPGDAVDSNRFSRSQNNPIVIDGIMYLTSARHRAYAVNAGTGELIWSFDPFDGGPGGGNYRGVTYWEDGGDKRILFTAGDKLYALNAETGKPISTFGHNGSVSMNVGIRDDPEKISIIPTSPGIVYRDLLIIGNEVSELYGAAPGYVRAYNIKTGKLEWTFHTIPKPGEVGYETWPKDAWKYVGGANCWAGLSVDEKRGMVFFGTGSPTYDFYGADRPGMNLFGNSVVALDAGTGAYRWHFQTVHHDLWDYDLPAPPNLITVKKDGKNLDAVAQVSKVGFVYVLDRETGEPIFPVEERPVPESDVPGEQTWPTQPFPLKPKPYSPQSLTENDIADYSPESRDSMIRQFRRWRFEGLFTPPSERGTLMIPGTIGGAEWGGAAFDKESGILYVKANNAPEINQLLKVDPDDKGETVQGYDEGQKLYTTYCASCHKADRKGGEPFYPSLIGIDKRMSKEQTIEKIRTGGGKMPPFASVIKGKEDAIISFLFNIRDRKEARKNYEIREMMKNKSALADKEEIKDTTAKYLNLSAYIPIRSLEGKPFVKPPYGTLNAINMNTGEYDWTVPVGNYPDLQKPGEPPTGGESNQGPIVTAGGIVFSCGTRDKTLQAFDKSTGKLLWETVLPGVGSSTPSTYYWKGKQYVALSVAGDKKSPSGYVIAFALP